MKCDVPFGSKYGGSPFALLKGIADGNYPDEPYNLSDWKASEKSLYTLYQRSCNRNIRKRPDAANLIDSIRQIENALAENADTVVFPPHPHWIFNPRPISAPPMKLSHSDPPPTSDSSLEYGYHVA